MTKTLHKEMTNGNMYEWVTGTKNPLAGECPHGCTYCSTHKLMRYPVIKAKYSGEPRLCYKTLSQSLGKDNTWFIVSQNDLFAREIPDNWIYEVLNWCCNYDNVYLFQTKNPDRYIPFVSFFPPESILCTTIETNRVYPQMKKAPTPAERAFAMSCIDKFTKYVTIEPIMDFDIDELVGMIKACDPLQVNIGGDSGHNNLPEPSREKLLSLIGELKKFTTIDQKRNLDRLLK